MTRQKSSGWQRGLFSLCLLGVSGGCSAQAPQQDPQAAVPSGYKLVWADEFETPGLPDPKTWFFETSGNANLWGHNERQYYSEGRLKNARIEDGMLTIEAHHESMEGAPGWAGQEYTSAKLITRGQKAWKYGFYDIRAKLPCGLGTWPAIWLLADHGSWPRDGEIDIMETVGHEPGRVYGTLHTARSANEPFIDKANGIATSVPDACTAFHNYQLDWRRDSITMLVDGKPYFNAKRDAPKGTQWPFDRPFFMILNVAVGGAWGGQKGIDPSVFPAKMVIDYVRVYQTAK